MSEWEGGTQPASPMPTPNRASIMWRKFCARPHSTVMADQTAIARDTMVRRVPRSAQRAMGMPKVA